MICITVFLFALAGLECAWVWASNCDSSRFCLVNRFCFDLADGQECENILEWFLTNFQFLPKFHISHCIFGLCIEFVRELFAFVWFWFWGLSKHFTPLQAMEKGLGLSHGLQCQFLRRESRTFLTCGAAGSCALVWIVRLQKFDRRDNMIFTVHLNRLID